MKIYDKFRLLGTQTNRLNILATPFKKECKVSVKARCTKSGTTYIGVYTRSGNTFTATETYTLVDSDNDGIVEQKEIEIKKGQYIGVIGAIHQNLIESKVVDKKAQQDVIVYRNESGNATDYKTATIADVYQYGYDICMTIEVEDENYNLRQFVNDYWDRPTTNNETVRGYDFFRVSVNLNHEDLTSTSGSTNNAITPKSVDCVCVMPKNYNPSGDKVKVCAYVHGAGSTIGSNVGTTVGFADSRLDFLLDNGYAIFDINGHRNNLNMGNQQTCEAYHKAFEYVKKHYNVEDTCYVIGNSMGGLSAFNYCTHYPNDVKCCALVFPCLDMYNQAFLDPWDSGVPRGIAVAYNFQDKTGATYEADKVREYNPAKYHLRVIDGVKYQDFPVPLRIWHGLADVTVKIEHTREVYKAMLNGGTPVEMREIEGMGHGFTDAVRQEIINWMFRF